MKSPRAPCLTRIYALIGLGAGLVIASNCGAQTLGPAAPAPTLPSPVTTTLDATTMQSLSSPRLGAPDLAFGAFQRGYYVTAMREAMKRVETHPDDAPAMTLIAELYAQGLGVRSNPVEAAHWLKLATDHGDPQATFALGLAELNGEGVPKDHAGAQKLFEKAAAQNHPGALYNLGVMALDNTTGVAPDFTKAARYFKQAAELGDPDGALGLGLLFRNGTGVEKSDKHAAEWISRAAEEGNIPATVEYAIMLFNGTGVAKDETAAAKLFLKAAARDNPIAQNRVARLFASGRGVGKNMIEAMKWHILARAAGLNDAWLDNKLNELSPEDKAAVSVAVHQYVGN